MKKLIVVLIVFSSLTASFASTAVPKECYYSSAKAIGKTESPSQVNKSRNLPKDCTVKLNFTLEDGTKIQGEVTFVDVSWWDCTKMQVAAWWHRNF